MPHSPPPPPPHSASRSPLPFVSYSPCPKISYSNVLPLSLPPSLCPPPPPPPPPLPASLPSSYLSPSPSYLSPIYLSPSPSLPPSLSFSLPTSLPISLPSSLLPSLLPLLSSPPWVAKIPLQFHSHTGPRLCLHRAVCFWNVVTFLAHTHPYCPTSLTEGLGDYTRRITPDYTIILQDGVLLNVSAPPPQPSGLFPS